MPKTLADADLYEKLGVAPTASPDEISAAFRSLAKQLHPDLHPGDATVADEFKSLTSAYKVLADPGARERYDRRRVPPARPPTAPVADTRSKEHSREPLFRTVRTARIGLWSGVGLVALGVAGAAVLVNVPTGDAGKTITLWLVVAKLLVGGAILSVAAAWRLRRLRWAAAA